MKFFGRKDCKNILNAAKKKLKKLDMKQIDFLEDNPIFGNQILCTYYRVWSKAKRLHSLKRIKNFHYSGSIVKIKINENSLHCVKSVRIRSYSGPHFSHIFPHLDWIRRGASYLSVLSPNSGKRRKNTDQNNSKYWHFLCSATAANNTCQWLQRIFSWCHFSTTFWIFIKNITIIILYFDYAFSVAFLICESFIIFLCLLITCITFLIVSSSIILHSESNPLHICAFFSKIKFYCEL